MISAGTYFLFSPVLGFLSIVKWFADIASIAGGIVAVIIGTLFTMIIITVGWIFRRPLVAVPILLLSAAAVVYVLYSQEASAVAPVPSTA